MKPANLRRAAAVAVLLAALTAAAFSLRSRTGVARPRRFDKNVTAMGTFVTVSVFTDDQAAAEEAVDAAIDTIKRLERLLSRFNPESDVSRVNDAAAGEPVSVQRETLEVLDLARLVSRQSGGAFDVTVGPLVVLWREAGESGTLPTPEAIAAARSKVSWKDVLIDAEAGTVTRAREGISIDLSAIAKGYVAAAALGDLRAAGMESGFVNAGGDIAFLSVNPDGSPWRVGVADPRDDTRTLRVLHVRDAAVVTSGDYEQFSTIDGKRYSHIIDPRTGNALEGGGPVSVTVVSQSAALADAWATALSVLGEDGLGAAREAGVECLLLYLDGEEIRTVESPGFADLTPPLGQRTTHRGE